MSEQTTTREGVYHNEIKIHGAKHGYLCAKILAYCTISTQICNYATQTAENLLAIIKPLLYDALPIALKDVDQSIKRSTTKAIYSTSLTYCYHKEYKHPNNIILMKYSQVLLVPEFVV